MLRFAPSPTGDMHIGNLRVAIFNYIVAKQKKEDLLVRIEDTDKERNIEGKDKEILDILNLFGIEYSHVVEQSSHLKHHRTMALQLLKDKQAFSCFCTPEQLEADRDAAKNAKKAYRYSGRCENLAAELVIDNENPFTIRIKKPKSTIVIEDIIKGKVSFEANEVDSFIIMRQDKYPTYNFACAIDDMIADISLVIRGEDHMSNTPKQVHIRRALGYTKEIAYAHLPIILNAEGKKMSKRDDASSVKWLLQEGFLPSAIINYLIVIGNKTPKDIFTLEEAIEFFTLENISKSPAKFDMNLLRHINRQHLLLLDNKELSRYVEFADDEIGSLARLYLDESSTLKELREKVSPYFGEKVIPDEFMENTKILREIILNAPFFEEYNDFKKHLMQESGLKGKNFFKPLRYVLSGAEHGPDVSEIYNSIKNYLQEIVKH